MTAATSTDILVPLDGSARSESVFPWLRLLASAAPEPPRVELVRCFQPVSSVYSLPDLVIDPGSYLSIEALEKMIKNYLHEKAAQLSDLQVTTSAVLNDAGVGVLERSKSAALILMATQGAGGLSRFLLGSVASRVAHGSGKPILVLTARAVERPAKVERILVAVDGSEPAERALARAAELARQLQASLFLYQAVGLTDELHSVIAEHNRRQVERAEAYLKTLAGSLEGLEVQTEARGVRDRTNIVAVAEEKDADLLVLGSRGKGALERAVLGSQSEQAMRHAHCPVLIVP